MRNILISFTLFLAFATPAVSDEILLLADEWCPYNCATDAKDQGFVIDIARRAFEKAGHTLSYKVLPWARAIEEARADKASGIIGAYKEDAPDFIFPDEAVSSSGQGFFSKTGFSWQFKDVSSLDTVSIGVIQDYAYGDLLDSYIKKHISNPSKIQFSSGDNALDINVKKLLAGRISVLVEDEAVMKHLMNTEKIADKIQLVGSLPAEPLYIAFAPKGKKSKEYAKILSDEIKTLKSSNEMKSILAKYGL